MTSRRSPQRVARRREQILDAARRLFNEHGTAAVSVARIARESAVSPGNLYYWFPGKTEIIRALFEGWSADCDPRADACGEPETILRRLAALGGHQAQVSADYAFFPRELFALLHSDPVLQLMYRENFERRMASLHDAVALVIDAGLIRRPRPPATTHDTLAGLWLLAEFALPFTETVGEFGFDAAAVHMSMIEPLLTDRGRDTLGLTPTPRRTDK